MTKTIYLTADGCVLIRDNGLYHDDKFIINRIFKKIVISDHQFYIENSEHDIATWMVVEISKITKMSTDEVLKYISDYKESDEK